MCAVRCLHHMELAVRNASKKIDFFNAKFGFQLLAETRPAQQDLAASSASASKKWAINSEEAIFVLTEQQQEPKAMGKNKLVRAAGAEGEAGGGVRGGGGGGGGCGSLWKPESVTNAAFSVRNVEAVAERVARRGGVVLEEPRFEEDAFGVVQMAKVKSIVGDVEHTLIDASKYRGPFLPSYVSPNASSAGSPLSSSSSSSSLSVSLSGAKGLLQPAPSPPIVRGIDHVTFVCESGRGADVAKWYQECFGMQRLVTNKLDDPREGLQIKGDVGLRLRALQYWKCAELGVVAPSYDARGGSKGGGGGGGGQDLYDKGGLRIVIAESLWPDRTNAHVEEYLEEHVGPGIQHVGLVSDDICRSVRECVRRGVQFRRPPPTYYDLEFKKQDIARARLDLKEMSELGILVDAEADARAALADKDRFLLQIFTTPIFEEETFFLEIIQRRGALGFGEGNVTALALSIDLENKKKAAALAATLAQESQHKKILSKS